MSELRLSTTSGDARIRLSAENDADAVADLSLRAWEPVFRSFRAVLGDAIYFRLYPDWRQIQNGAVRRTCLDPEMETFVIERDGVVAGFAALAKQQDPPMGIVDMIAVDPSYQRRGLGRSLLLFAMEHFTANGLNLVNVGTGGDPGHAPARRLYEDVGFEPLQLVNYYRGIDPA